MRISDWSSDVCSSDLEVIAIRLDDIVWRAGELLVRGKGQRYDRLPVPPDVGEAIAAYVREERISASRTLFVSLRAPNGPFKDGQVINTILKDAFAATGVTPPGPYVGSHVLRHSLATNLVRNGASRSEEHKSELQSLMRLSYSVFCLKKKQHERRSEKHIDK